jgi:hypothetical protein
MSAWCERRRERARGQRAHREEKRDLVVHLSDGLLFLVVGVQQLEEGLVRLRRGRALDQLHKLTSLIELISSGGSWWPTSLSGSLLVRGGGDLRLALHPDPVARREELVEALEQSGLASKERLDSRDDVVYAQPAPE